MGSIGWPFCDVSCRSNRGVPSHDQLGIVFAKLDAQQFQSCFIAWVERFTTAVREVVAVDGRRCAGRSIRPPGRGRSI